MDPNTTLADLRQHVALTRDETVTAQARHAHALHALELFDALDGWLSRGGLTPTPWARAQGDVPAAARRPAWTSGRRL